MLEIITKTKSCTKCKLEKPIDSFHKSKKEKDGYQTYCKECKKNYTKSNKTLISKEYFINYRCVNREKILLQKNEYRISNRDNIKAYSIVYREQHREYFAKKSSEYSKTEKGKASNKNRKHILRSKKKQGDVTSKQIIELKRNSKVCYWCKCSLKNVHAHIDHYNPLSKGGEHTISNLVMSCQSCNNRKHAKDPIVFANSIGRLL